MSDRWRAALSNPPLRDPNIPPSPGVPLSQWFLHRFVKKGIPSRASVIDKEGSFPRLAETAKAPTARVHFLTALNGHQDEQAKSNFKQGREAGLWVV
jgi:hypothetical protein